MCLTYKFTSTVLVLTVLCQPIAAQAEFSTFNDVQANFAKVSTVESGKSAQPNDLYVVSDEELNKYSNSAEMIREIKILKQDKTVLLDYSRKLREKYKALESYYANKVTDGSLQVSSRTDGSGTEFHIISQENAKLRQDNQNLRTEYDALKLQEKALQDQLAQLKDKLTTTNATVETFKTAFDKKKNEAQICQADLDKSQKQVSRIPEMEKEIVGLKNELILKKSAAELLAGATPPKVNQPFDTKQEIVASRKQTQVAPVDKLNADVLVVEVSADKVALRAGPGMNNSQIMDIGKGARLTVEAKEGEWYRVNAPTGGRAYILAKYVRTIDGGLPKGEKISRNAKVDSEVIPFDPEATKPPLPQKPVKRTASAKSKQRPSLSGDSITQESVALEALKKAMNQNVTTE